MGILSGHKEVLMTRLRKMMLEELERRNYSEATTRCYIRTVEDFSKRFKRSPDGLDPEHIREYQAELFKKRKLSPGTVTQRLAALRFFQLLDSIRVRFESVAQFLRCDTETIRPRNPRQGIPGFAEHGGHG